MDVRAALLAVDVVVPHTDADGLAAGAMVLRERGQAAEAACLFGRGENPWTAAPSGTPALLDWGVRAYAGPAVMVDHHVPEAEPRADQTVLSGHGELPETTTAALVRRVCGDQPAWLAAVGAVGDLGDAGFALPECQGAPKTLVRRLVPLINAPRRGPRLEGVRTALALLVEHDDPKRLVGDPRMAVLEAARDAWRADWERVRRTAPQVGEQIALVRFASEFQLHPLAAQMWSRRLSPRVVLAANDGYLPGRVAFSVRGGSRDLRALLRDALPGVRGEFAHGHPRATGGTLAAEEFERLLEALRR
jgi:single-stranded-DNA-specific exonuclease